MLFTSFKQLYLQERNTSLQTLPVHYAMEELKKDFSLYYCDNYSSILPIKRRFSKVRLECTALKQVLENLELI